MEETSLEKRFLNRDDFRGRVKIFLWSRTKVFFLKTKLYYTNSNKDNDSFIFITHDKNCTLQLIILKNLPFFSTI